MPLLLSGVLSPRKILTAGGATLDSKAEDVLQDLVNDGYSNQIPVGVDIMVVLGMGRSLISMMTADKNNIVPIFDSENSRIKGVNITVPLRSERSDLYSFMLDLTADRYGAKEQAMKAVANAQVGHRWLGPLHAQSLDILRKRDDTGITFEGAGAVSDCGICAVKKARQLPQLKIINHKVNRPFQLCYGDLMGPFTPVAIGGYNYVSKVNGEYTK